MLNRLYAKLSIGLVIVLVSVGMIYGGGMFFILQRLNQSVQQQLNYNLASDLVKDKRIVKNGKIDKQALKQTFHQYMVINPSIEIYYLDLAGNILSYSADPGVVKRNSVDLAPIRQFLSNQHQFLLGDDPRSHELKKPFSVTPIPDKTKAHGYLYVVLQGQEFSEAHASQQNYYVLILGSSILGVSLLVGLIIGLIIFSRLTRRLQRLQQKVTVFADNGYRQPELFADTEQALNLAQGDEVAMLDQYISQMSQHIAEQWAALSQQDQLRREMIASISHDLRTPLAAIRGYLETIVLKYSKLSETDRLRYLDITIKQTQRLEKLINQLFEFAKLEARDEPVVFEALPILELVYDVVGKFKIQAEAKAIDLVISPQAEDLQVTADIGLIERVLDNLLANAIQYSPSHSQITLDVVLKEQQVQVSVSDQGNGIAQAQQPLIFQRFYRADNPSRSGGSSNAGLGLAIVKKIITMHQQKIWLASELGTGTSFYFTLALDV